MLKLFHFQPCNANKRILLKDNYSLIFIDKFKRTFLYD